MTAAPVPGNDRPRFRQDLLAELVEDGGQRFVDVMDPESGNLFRFYEVEFSLACAMDGERDITGIVKWAQEELGLTPSPAEIRTVISALGELGYLDGRAPAAAARADELAPGVVVGQRRPEPARQNIELGGAGTAGQRGQEMPKAPDMTLGAPGAAHKRVNTPVEEIPLGAPGRAEPRRTPRPQPAAQPPQDVSLDLADQMSVRPDDVKEAVRASKVMKAVDVPPELRDAAGFEDRPTQRPTPPPVVEDRTVPRQPTPPRAADRPAVELRKPADRPPTPTPTPGYDRPPIVQPPGPATRWTMVVLAIAVIVVIGGAGAFFVWKFLVKKSNDDAAQDKTSEQLQPQPTPPQPPPPPPPPAVTLASEPAPPIEMKPAVTAPLEFIETQKAVKKGDVLVKLGGNERLQRAINENQTAIDKRVKPDLEMYQKRIDTLKATNRSEADIKAAQALYDGRKRDLDDRQKTIDQKSAELEKLIFKAPSDGEFTPAAKAGGRVTPADMLGTFTPAPLLVATFKPEGAAPPIDSSVYVAIKGTEATKLVCKVASVDAGGMKVACPGDAALVGKEVTYAGPAPAEVPVETPVEGPGSVGSAAEPPKAPTQAPAPRPPAPKPPAPSIPRSAPDEPKPDGSGAPKSEGSAG